MFTAKDNLIEKAKLIKEHGNMLGVEVTIPGQKSTELIINANESIDNKIKYYCENYNDILVHKNNNQIAIVKIHEVDSVKTSKGNIEF